MSNPLEIGMFICHSLDTHFLYILRALTHSAARFNYSIFIAVSHNKFGPLSQHNLSSPSNVIMFGFMYVLQLHLIERYRWIHHLLHFLFLTWSDHTKTLEGFGALYGAENEANQNNTGVEREARNQRPSDTFARRWIKARVGELTIVLTTVCLKPTSTIKYLADGITQEYCFACYCSNSKLFRESYLNNMDFSSWSLCLYDSVIYSTL